jgi:putative hydrolase of the HAD superfamily
MIHPPAPNGYRALLTDLGGVLLVITEERFQSAASRFGLTRDELYRVLYSSLAWRQLEVGNIDITEYWRRVIFTAPSLAGMTYEAVETLLFGEDWGVDREMIAAMQALRPEYRLGVLSNHYTGIRRALEAKGIASLFNDIVISAEVKVAKPSESAVSLALDRLGVLARETVFIDDNPDHVWTARRLGMAAIEHRSTKTTLASLRGLFPALANP